MPEKRTTLRRDEIAKYVVNDPKNHHVITQIEKLFDDTTINDIEASRIPEEAVTQYADAIFDLETTDDLAEGGDNLYFTDERAQAAVDAFLGDSAAPSPAIAYAAAEAAANSAIEQIPFMRPVVQDEPLPPMPNVRYNTEEYEPRPPIISFPLEADVIDSAYPAAVRAQAMAASAQSASSPDAQPLVDYGGINFNGTFYLDGNALTGIADGKAGEIVIPFRFANAASTTEYLIGNTGERFFVARLSNGQIRVGATNAAGTTILQIQSAVGACSAAGLYIIHASWDLATAGSGRMRISDVSSYLETTYTNDTIDYTVTEWAIGARSNGASPAAGDMYYMWFNAAWAELNTVSNCRKFYDALLTLNFLGGNGEFPTGSPPSLFLGYSRSDNWDKNKGALYGTSFVRNGTIADAVAPIKGRFGDWIDKTLTPSASTGNITINKRAGTVQFAAGTNSLTVTNSLVRPEDRPIAIMTTNDAAAGGVKSAVTAALGGSFTIRLAANCAATTEVTWFLI